MPVYGSIGEFLQATIAFIAIANPIAALPVFLSLVATDDPAARRAAANRMSLAVFAILAEPCSSAASCSSSSASPSPPSGSAAAWW